MKRSLCIITLIGILFIGCSKQNFFDLALTNVTLYDSTSKKILKNKTILIQDEIIADIIDGDETFAAKIKIEGNGRLVTPGFIDTHIHLTDIFGDYEQAPQYLSPDSSIFYREQLAHTFLNYGVTSVAEMGQPESWMKLTLNWQKQPNPNYPNIFNSGSALISDEERAPYVSHVEVENPSETILKIQNYHEMGLDHIKLYWRLREPEMKAAVEKAKSLNMRMYAHIDNNILSINEVLELGVRHFEHASTISNDVFNFSQDGNLLMEIMQKNYPGISAYMPFALEKIQYVEDNTTLRLKRDELISRMIENSATLSTTIHLFGSFCGRTFFNSFLEDYYTNENPQLSDKQIKRLNKAFDTYMSYIKTAHERGLKLRIGTDCQQGGKAVLSEMLLLCEAGLPIEDVLQIATYNGAEALGVEDDYGSLQLGKKADILMFDNNPLEDYNNLLSRKTIIKGGKIYKD